MTLDIGTAFREGLSRTVARSGLLLAALFVAVALLSTVLLQSFVLEGLESLIEFQQGVTPEEMGMTREEYQESLEDLQTAHDQVRADLALAADIPLGVAAGGLLVLALVSEAVNVVAIRVFASDATEDIPGELATDNILLATLNGFVGGIVAWGLIVLGSALFLVPGLFFAVAFFFLRQEIALKDKNFVQAMADSWRLTKGDRLNVFALGFVLVVVVWAIYLSVGGAVGLVSTLASDVLAAILGGVFVGGGLLGVFGTAVATRAYLQLEETAPDVLADADEEDDPYAAALGPDDLPK